jgi:hypothetical protein
VPDVKFGINNKLYLLLMSVGRFFGCGDPRRLHHPVPLSPLLGRFHDRGMFTALFADNNPLSWQGSQRGGHLTTPGAG